MKQVSQNAILIMLFTNTNTTYLIILAYLNFTEFEHPSMFVCCRPRRLTSLFPKKARQQAHPPMEDAQISIFFFVFFFVFFFCVFIFWFGRGVLGWSRHFYIGVVELPGLILSNTGIQWDGGKNQHDPFYVTAENLKSRSSYAFSNFDFGIYTFIEDSFHIYSASLRELVHLYTDSLKDMLKSFRFRLMRPLSDLNRLFHQMLLIWYRIQPSLKKYITQWVFLYVKWDSSSFV